MKRNKKIKTIISISLLSVILIFTLSFGVSASAEALAENNRTENNNAENEINEEINSEEDGEVWEDNLFEQIYEALRENADKIFSALAFIGTLIVSYAYKKGLIPQLTEALSKFKGYLEKVKEDTELHDRKSDERIEIITKNVSTIEKTLSENGDKLKRLDEELSGYGDVVRDHEIMRILFSSQIDMLYSIFMASALPQYQKEEIGNKISKMREELESYGKLEQ